MLGYGIALPGSADVLTPFAEVGLTEDAGLRRLRLGTRLELAPADGRSSLAPSCGRHRQPGVDLVRLLRSSSSAMASWAGPEPLNPHSKPLGEYRHTANEGSSSRGEPSGRVTMARPAGSRRPT